MKKLLSGLHSLCTKKANYLTGNIKNPSVKTNAMAQLNEHCSQLSNCLSFLLSSEHHRVESDDLFVNILYKFDSSDVWCHIPVNEIGITDDQLFSECSFLTKLKNDNSNYLF